MANVCIRLIRLSTSQAGCGQEFQFASRRALLEFRGKLRHDSSNSSERSSRITLIGPNWEFHLSHPECAIYLVPVGMAPSLHRCTTLDIIQASSCYGNSLEQRFESCSGGPPWFSTLTWLRAQLLPQSFSHVGTRNIMTS